jgi:hypothetical protein
LIFFKDVGVRGGGGIGGDDDEVGGVVVEIVKF